MSKLSTKPPVWKKPKTKVYDYNYNLGEHYYKPQLDHMESKYANRAASPPRAGTFAERFAKNPVYGNLSPLEYRTSSTSALDSSLTTRRSSLQNEFSSEIGSSSNTRRQALFESSRGLTPDLDDTRTRVAGRPRLDLGERLLEAAGHYGGSRSHLVDTNFGHGASPAVPEDPFDESFFHRRRLGAARSAEADFVTEDPFRRRMEALNIASGNNEEDYSLSDFRKDSESQVAGFRSRMQARRQREEQANSSELESSGIESRVDRIRSRAKARLADLEADELAYEPNLSARVRSGQDSVSRARAVLRDMDDLDASSNLSSSVGATKTLRITKRTIRTTVESE